VSRKLEVGLIGSTPNIWKCYIQGEIDQSVERRRLVAAVKVCQSSNSVIDIYQCFDTKRFKTVDLDGFVLFAMTNAEHSISLRPTLLGSPKKNQMRPGEITLVRVGGEHQCNWPKSGCNHFWHGPRACILEANGFIAFADGANFAEVCKKWQLPPPPAPTAPHPLIPARVAMSPVAHDAKTGTVRSVPKQRPVDRSPPTNGTDKPKFEDVLESPVSPATQAASLSEDQRSWQMDVESTVVGDTKLVFARDQVLPMTFHVLPGSSQSSVGTMIAVSPTITLGPRTDQTASMRRCNRTSKPSFYPCGSDSLQYLRSMDFHRWISSDCTAWMGSRVSSDQQIGQYPGLRGEEYMSLRGRSGSGVGVDLKHEA
jgi:hypothetical protein